MADAQDFPNKTTKEWVQTIGIVLTASGIMRFPVAIGVSPKRDTSLFYNFADLGAFWMAGIVLFGVGALVVLISVVIPGDRSE